MKVLVTYN